MVKDNQLKEKDNEFIELAKISLSLLENNLKRMELKNSTSLEEKLQLENEIENLKKYSGEGMLTSVYVYVVSLSICAILMMARVIAASSGSVVMSRTNDWSILSWSRGRRLR